MVLLHELAAFSVIGILATNMLTRTNEMQPKTKR